MSDLSQRISNEVRALEDRAETYKRDADFYLRLLRQIALQQGGSIEIDSKYGLEALEDKHGILIDSKGFHLTSGGELLKIAGHPRAVLTEIDLKVPMQCHACRNKTSSYVSSYNEQAICCMACKTPRKDIPMLPKD
jgi:hypothetical protein